MKKIVLALALMLLSVATCFAQYAPTARSETDSPTFTWPPTLNAATYRFYLNQIGTAAPNIVLTPDQAGCSGNVGTCSYTPTAAAGFQIPLSRGHVAAWWIESRDAAGNVIFDPGGQPFYVDTVNGTTNTDFNVGYIDQFDQIPCTKWYYVTDFVGQSRRVIDFSMGSGTNNLGGQVFHKDMWNTVDISDLVPATARAATISMQVIYSATCAAAAGGDACDLLGWSVRRHGGGVASNIPNGVLRYTAGASRTPVEFTVPLNNGKFDFYWSNTANGITVSSMNKSNVTGEAMNGSLVGYCTP